MHVQLVSASKTGGSIIAKDKEIIIATPESPSIVNAEFDEVDGNILSGKMKQIGKIANVVTGNKSETKGKSKTMDNAELAGVHQSPAKSTAESSSTGSSTWSVKMSPIKKRFSLSSKVKRSTSMVATPTESNEDESKKGKETKDKDDKDEVLFHHSGCRSHTSSFVACIFKGTLSAPYFVHISRDLILFLVDAIYIHFVITIVEIRYFVLLVTL